MPTLPIHAYRTENDENHLFWFHDIYKEPNINSEMESALKANNNYSPYIRRVNLEYLFA